MVRAAPQIMAKAQTDLRKEDFDGGKAKSGVAVAMAMAMAPTKEENAAAVVEDLNVQAMAESGVHVVPPRFVRPAEELASFCPHTHVTLEPVPMIDITGLFDFRRVFTMAAIASACRDWGCFQVLEHDLPQSLLDGVLKVSREFFELPLREKQKFTPSYGRQSVDSEHAVLDWSDLMFHRDLDTDVGWPTQPSVYRETMVAYGQEIRKLIEQLLAALSEELRLLPTYFQNLLGEPEQPLRVNYYPRCPQPELVMGLRAHTDPGMMTSLLQDQTRGLQIKKGDHWVTVDPESDAVVIFVGDQLQRASNGRFKAVEHRAVVNKEKDRLSIVTGLNPNLKAEIGPAAKLVNQLHPALYETRTYADIRATSARGIKW